MHDLGRKKLRVKQWTLLLLAHTVVSVMLHGFVIILVTLAMLHHAIKHNNLIIGLKY